MLVVFILACGAAIIVYPAVAARTTIVLCRNMRLCGRKVKLRGVETALLFSGVLPGVALPALIREDLAYVIPMGVGVAVALVWGAVLGKFRASLAAAEASDAAALRSMLLGMLRSVPWCVALLVFVPSQIPSL